MIDDGDRVYRDFHLCLYCFCFPVFRNVVPANGLQNCDFRLIRGLQNDDLFSFKLFQIRKRRGKTPVFGFIRQFVYQFNC